MTPAKHLPSAPSMSSSSATLTVGGRSWLLLALVLLLVVVSFALLWPTTHSLLVEWEDTDKTTYTHGYLIVLISTWLLLRDRRELGMQPTAPSLAACVLLAGASLVWLVALRSGVHTGEQAMLPAMMWLAVWSAMGRRAALLAAFPLGYLYFAIPIWGSINDVLQSATVVAVDLMLRATGVSAWVDGNIVHLAAGTFEIASGCSGLHFFIVALALATLYGEVHRDNLVTRAKTVALAVALALITNWMRVYCIVLAGYLTDMQHYLVRVEHYRFGWVVFAVSMVVFFLIVRRFGMADHAILWAASAHDRLSSRRDLLRGAAITIAVLAIGPLWNVIAPVRAAQLPGVAAMLPVNPGEWSGPRAQNGLNWNPAFVGADVQQGGEYRSNGRAVQAFMAAYAWQSQGKELVGYGNVLWEPESAVLSTQASQHVPGAKELILANAAGTQTLLWYTYRVGSIQTASGLLAQVSYGAASLAKSPLSHLAALRSACVPDCEAARSTLRDFARASGWPQIAVQDQPRRAQ